MIIELRRVFSTVGSRSRGRTLFEFLVLPLLVAVIMTTAFLARSAPDAQCEPFLFFGTLYAFWCGLFGACQAFNGEVSSGEWSYWVLGMHRSVAKHYFAHFAVALLFAMLQVAVSLFFLWFLWQIGVWCEPLGNLFMYRGEGNSFVNQVGSMLKGGTAFNLEGLQCAMNGADQAVHAVNGLWFRFSAFYCLWGMLAGIASGVAIGLLVSASCSTPQVSLTVSVFLIVACSIFSHTGILGYGNDRNMDREFSPLDLILRQQGRQFGESDAGKKHQTLWKDGGFVEQSSFLLPQRYFFNIARIPCLKLDSSLGRGADEEGRGWSDPRRLFDHSENRAGYCKCPVCLGILSVVDREGHLVVIGRDGQEWPFENHWMAGGNAKGHWRDDVLGADSLKGPKAFRTAERDNKGDIQSLFGLCRRIGLVETAMLAVWCFGYGVLTWILLKRKGAFNELR